ncbi:MAG: NifU family protein [Candidatus Dormibacteria bacterium]
MSILRDKELQRRVGHVESLIQELDSLEDPGAREGAVAAIQALLQLHGDALDRIMRIVAGAAGGGEALSEQLGNDELVSCVLMLHGLHPVPIEKRVETALVKVRPYMDSHGGNVVLVGIDAGVVHLRLEGSCHGCGSSAVTMKYAVEEAIMEQAPDVMGIITDGVEEPAVESGFVSLSSFEKPNGGGGWHEVRDAQSMGSGQVRGVVEGNVQLLMCRLDGNWYAYRDRCPGCQGALGDSRLETTVLTCPSCQKRFDVRQAGRCLDHDATSLHLDPLPLLVDNGVVRVATPVATG